MTIRQLLAKATSAVADRTQWVQARIISTWQAGRPLPAPDDYEKFYTEGYLENPVVAACVWEICTSAAEPKLVVKRKKKDGTLELATGYDADGLRQLLEHPNPEQTNYTFLEQLFTHQQITGNWFFRKIRAATGRGVVQLWACNPAHTSIILGSNGWVSGYKLSGLKDTVVAEDMVHDPLHPHPLKEPWGVGPIAILRRVIDMDNQGFEYLRTFFYNNATPSGLLKLKARMDPVDRNRIKELWTKEHSGSQGWHSVSVLDADGDYVALGTSPDKLRLQAIWDQTESRICMVYGVPPILVGTSVGLNRSTFANYGEARKSLWQETLTPLYSRCAQRLTSGVAREFNPDLVIEFDLSSVEALQEQKKDKRSFAIEGYGAGMLTLNQALEMVGLPSIGPEGDSRKTATPVPSGLDGLFARAGHQHARGLTPDQKKSLARFKKIVEAHFKKQGAAVLAHLK